jgi:hypothetical protein
LLEKLNKEINILKYILYIYKKSNEKQNKMEVLEILYLSIEQMDAKIENASAKKKKKLQIKINYAFDLIDKIKANEKAN